MYFIYHIKPSATKNILNFNIDFDNVFLIESVFLSEINCIGFVSKIGRQNNSS